MYIYLYIYICIYMARGMLITIRPEFLRVAPAHIRAVRISPSRPSAHSRLPTDGALKSNPWKKIGAQSANTGCCNGCLSLLLVVAIVAVVAVCCCCCSLLLLLLASTQLHPPSHHEEVSHAPDHEEISHAAHRMQDTSASSNTSPASLPS